MARRSTLDILTALPRTNCRECGAPTCLAFAAAVVAGSRRLTECPYLAPDDAARLGEALPAPDAYDTDLAAALAPMKAQVAAVDLAAAAPRLGGTLVDGRLRLHILGRVFELDARGELTSQCHVNRWVHFPLLAYVLGAEGRAPTGTWVPFRELRTTSSWVRFFEHRCEAPFQAMAEAHGDVLVDLLGVFGGRPPTAPRAPAAPGAGAGPAAPGAGAAPAAGPGVLPGAGAGSAAGTDADWALVLHPFPKVPLLFLVWEAQDDFPAKLTLLFDRSVEANLSAEALYNLVGGLVEMFTKLVRRHAGP